MPYAPFPYQTFSSRIPSPRSWVWKEYLTTGVGPTYVPYSGLPLDAYPGLMAARRDLPWQTQIPGRVYFPPAPGLGGVGPVATGRAPSWPGPMFPGDQGVGWPRRGQQRVPPVTAAFLRDQARLRLARMSQSNPSRPDMVSGASHRPSTRRPSRLAVWKASQTKIRR